MPYIEPLANPIYCSLHTFGEVDIALSVHEPVMSCEPLEKRMENQPPPHTKIASGSKCDCIDSSFSTFALFSSGHYSEKSIHQANCTLHTCPLAFCLACHRQSSYTRLYTEVKEKDRLMSSAYFFFLISVGLAIIYTWIEIYLLNYSFEMRRVRGAGNKERRETNMDKFLDYVRVCGRQRFTSHQILAIRKYACVVLNATSVNLTVEYVILSAVTFASFALDAWLTFPQTSRPEIAGKNTVRWGGHGIILAVYTSFHDEHVNTQLNFNRIFSYVGCIFFFFF